MPSGTSGDNGSDRIHVRHDDESQQAFEQIREHFVERDRWNDDLSDAEVIRRMVKDYSRLLTEHHQTEMQFKEIMQFLSNEHPEVIQQLRNQISEEVHAQDHEQEPAHEQAQGQRPGQGQQEPVTDVFDSPIGD